MMKLSVVIPCYNERDTIEGIVAAVKAVSLPVMEIIVVDDFSSDGTAEILRARVCHQVDQVIFHSRNQGKGAAVRSGFKAGTGDVIVVQRADLEYDRRAHAMTLAP